MPSYGAGEGFRLGPLAVGSQYASFAYVGIMVKNGIGREVSLNLAEPRRPIALNACCPPAARQRCQQHARAQSECLQIILR